MAKKKTAKSTAETPSTTTLSVRFSETELEHLKEASQLANQAPATFAREAVFRTATETINATRDRRQTRAIEAIAARIASQLVDTKVHVEEATLVPEGVGLDQRIKRQLQDSYQKDDDQIEWTKVNAQTLNESERRNLLSVLGHAAGPFANALCESLTDLISEEGDLGFTPIIEEES